MEKRRMPETSGQKFYYVYIIESIHSPEHYYTGFTENLENRLNAHNAGKCTHTDKFKPWKIKTATAFSDQSKAFAFEKYLKTASGRAFAKKRL
jgi:putative endonuclease